MPTYLFVNNRLGAWQARHIDQPMAGDAYRGLAKIFSIEDGNTIYVATNIVRVGEGLQTKYHFTWKEVTE